MAIWAALFAAFTREEGFGPFAQLAMGRTDNLDVRFGAAVALAFNVLMVVVAIIAIALTVPGTTVSSSSAPQGGSR